MNQQKIDIVDTYNWQAMYLNGKKIAEVQKFFTDGGNHIGAAEALKALNISFEHYEINNQDPKDYFVDLAL